MYIDPRSQSTRALLATPPHLHLRTQQLHHNIMSVLAKEGRVILAIEAIRTSQEMSIRRAAKTYDVPRTSLVNRMKGMTPLADRRNAQHNLTLTKEETIVQYVLDLDSRGFPPRISDVRSMADLLRTTRHATPVGTKWPYNFVQRRPELKTRFSRAYDFQRALCEDPDIINAWFQLVANMRTKYGIQDCDFYNFDEIGFMMGVICGNMVVTRVDRCGRSKQL